MCEMMFIGDMVTMRIFEVRVDNLYLSNFEQKDGDHKNDDVDDDGPITEAAQSKA
jgi:hypothetical protein